MALRIIAASILLIVSIVIDGFSVDSFDENMFGNFGQVLSEETESKVVFVERVVDGDTIKLSTGETVRYIGIDTPETKDPRKGIECYDTEATNFNQRLVLGKSVRLESDVSDKDRYGRLLRYVYIDYGGEEIMVNKYLVENGYAVLSTYPPDVKYSEKFRIAEANARSNDLGLWKKCR